MRLFNFKTLVKFFPRPSRKDITLYIKNNNAQGNPSTSLHPSPKATENTAG